MFTVLLFAHLQEEVGQHQLQVEQADITVNELKEKLAGQYKLTQMNQVMVSINEEFATEDDVIKSGDTVAFIPPVSGG